MARSDKGVVIETRESPHGSVELKIHWDGDDAIIWMKCPSNLKIISKGKQ
jgi:hypothetical protein